MGAKMSSAKYQGKVIKLSEYKSFMKNLTCIYCDVPITHSAGCKKDLGDRQIIVSPYFRLKVKGSHHAENCLYDTSNVIKEIYAGIADKDLMTKENNKYLARLHIITDNMNRDVKTKNKQLNEGIVARKPTKKYIANGTRPAFLASMKRIVELKESLEKDEELQDLVVLQFYNERTKNYDEIKWKDFYINYDVKRYSYIYNKMRKSKIFHPICFAGEIKEVVELSVTDSYIIKFYSLKESTGVYLSLSIFTKSREVYEYASKLTKKRVVIYSNSHSIGKTIEISKDEGKVTYHNFSANINVKTQIFEL